MNPIELYEALPSHQLVYIMKDCKQLLAHPNCPHKEKVRTTLLALKDIMIRRQQNV